MSKQLSWSERLRPGWWIERRVWWAEYDAYLASPEWAARRDLVLDRAGGICEGCRCARATQAHHRNYDHVGDEFLFELVAVCDACHRRLHPHLQAVRSFDETWTEAAR